MKRFDICFIIFLLCTVITVRCSEAFFEASKIVMYGSVAGAASIVIYDALFKTIAPDEHKKTIAKLSIQDVLSFAGVGALYSLPIVFTSCAGSWPLFHAKDLIIPSTLGVISTSTAVGLKIKQLKGFLADGGQWEKVGTVVLNSNVVFSGGLCMWSLYNRFIKSHQV